MLSKDIQNRFAFHPATTLEKKNAHGSVRKACMDMAFFMNEHLPEGREKEIVVDKLEEVMFWANAAIARAGDEGGLT